MALQVWLPFTDGTLKQQGLSSLNFSLISTNTAVNTAGKLGKCYANDNLAAGGLLSDKTIELGQQQSMFCWFKFTELGSGSSLGGGLVSQHRHANNSGMGITIKYISSTTGYLSVNTGTGSSRTYNTYCGTTLLQADTWYHGGYTYDGSILKIYVNGVCEKTQAISGMYVPADYITTFCWSMNTTSGNDVYSSYKFKGSLNDVRIYDNCLTPEEVKKIAQGLILHYPLNNNGWGQENIFKNSANGISFTGSDYSAITTRTFDNTTGVGKIEINTANSTWNAWRFGTSDTSIATSVLSGGIATYTFSVDVRVTNYTSGTVKFGFDFRSNNVVSVSTTHFLTDNEKDGKWHRISCSLTTNSTADSQCLLSSGGSGNAGQIIEYKLFKLEVGSIATAWSPNSSDSGINSNIEYDCSGFCNNGTIYKYDNNGDIIIDSNTPKYSVCTHIKAGSPIENSVTGLCYIYSNCSLTTPNQLTISFWCKPIHNYQDSTSRQGVFCTTNDSIGTGAGTDYSTTAMHHRDSMIDVCQNGSAHSTINTPFIVDEWHHYTFLYNGKNIQWYKDGIFQSETVFDNADNLKSFSAIVIGFTKAGGVYRKNDCYMSDFRVYATALSAEDIFDLYNNAPSIYTFLPTSPNLWAAANQGIINKTFTGGLNSYVQTNCQVTLTDDGYRIYRPPNLNPTDNGNTMWGGFIFRQSTPLLLKGHTYMIKMDMKGQTSNGSETYWNNNAGWGGTANGLSTEYTWIERGDLPADWSSSDYVTRTWRFTVTGNTYKECTTTYSTFYADIVYPVFRDFKFGFNYANTGTLGTDLYIKNIRLYDITYETDLSKFE